MNPHSPAGPAFTAPAKKQLGQHFLADRHYIDKIVMAVNPKGDDRLVEIGPGQGAITLPLLRQHPRLTVIEFDRDLIEPLTAAAAPLGELTIVHRRKTLRNALNTVVSAEQFAAAGVRPDARAEQLEVAEFIALANAS